jgi:hypothetical protein
MRHLTPPPLSGGELAHALRNPLSSVKIALQALGREAPSQRTQLALREVRRMERLLAALSEWGRPLAPDGRPASLEALLSSAEQEVAEELAVRGVRVTLQPHAPALPEVRCEPLRVRPLLAQLLLECADRAPGSVHCPQLGEWTGGVELTLSAPGIAAAGGARACLAALDALLVPVGGWARTGGPDALVLRFAS